MIWMALLRENEERGKGATVWNKNSQEGLKNVRDAPTDVAVFEDEGEGLDPSSVGSFWKLKSSVGCHPIERQRLHRTPVASSA